MTINIAIDLIIATVVLILLIFLYRHILLSIIDKSYVKADFTTALEKINKFYKFLPLSHQRLIVYKTSIYILIDKDEEFLEEVNKINRKSHTYGPYYYYYYIAYEINHNDFVKAEKLYGDLTTIYKVSRDFDLVTPLAILMANKGDEKAFKKLKELKRNNHIDITFLAVTNRYIRRNKRNLD